MQYGKLMQIQRLRHMPCSCVDEGMALRGLGVFKQAYLNGGPFRLKRNPL